MNPVEIPIDELADMVISQHEYDYNVFYGLTNVQDAPKLNEETKMNISELKQSRFLQKSEVEPPIKVTIASVLMENIAQEGHPPENKYVLNFAEEVKPMVLNSTNGQLIAMALGSEETDDWQGKEIVLFNDPTVSFGGKVTGGIRARAVKTQQETVNF